MNFVIPKVNNKQVKQQLIDDIMMSFYMLYISALLLLAFLLNWIILI